MLCLMGFRELSTQNRWKGYNCLLIIVSLTRFTAFSTLSHREREDETRLTSEAGWGKTKALYLLNETPDTNPLYYTTHANHSPTQEHQQKL